MSQRWETRPCLDERRIGAHRAVLIRCRAGELEQLDVFALREELVGDYRRELGAAGIDYQLVDTSKPLDEALLAYLSTRGRRS